MVQAPQLQVTTVRVSPSSEAQDSAPAVGHSGYFGALFVPQSPAGRGHKESYCCRHSFLDGFIRQRVEFNLRVPLRRTSYFSTRGGGLGGPVFLYNP